MENINDNYSYSHPAIWQIVDNDNIKFTGLVDWSEKPYKKLEKKSGLGFSKNEILLMKKSLKPIYETPSDRTLPTLLFYSFFSIENLRVLQIEIKNTVFKWSSHKIGDQSEVTLGQLMQTIYNENAMNIDEYNTEKLLIKNYIRTEIKRLNDKTINIAVPIIINEIEQYKVFTQTVDRPYGERIEDTLQRPENTNISGTKLYRSISELFQ